MGGTTSSVMSLVVAAILWGCTNPFIKKGSSGVEDISEKSSTKKFFKEVKFLLSNWKYMTPFLLNQSGSLFYFLALQNTGNACCWATGGGRWLHGIRLASGLTTTSAGLEYGWTRIVYRWIGEGTLL
ncbi:transmembrane protein 234 homolog isoform X2 [Schistocerca serialis cubense]|uniref:transmembrane protein 234 homolog isoform X2 n=1 Tax=Schistocerca serialis cubense TaxID=2023355 RepID=UPI00214E4761|nr:transmembrane protein 234 homolog isoform X2 [Schistocerca serialis cubense]